MSKGDKNVMGKKKSSVTKNAFKGYSYQEYIYLLCVVLMDTRADIDWIDAEIGKDKHDFDDIQLMYNNTKCYFQMKNHKEFSESDYKVESNYVKVNGKKSFIKSDEINVMVMQTSTLVNNSSIFGIPARKEGNLYLITLSADEIAEFIDEQYVENMERNNQICHFAIKRIVEANFLIKKSELPNYNILDHELKEETLNIRDESLCIEKGILYIVGKPGIGKSHFVNELVKQVDNVVLYRFWINSQDEKKSERLKYKTFLLDLRYKLYNDFRFVDEKEIATELSKKNITLIIDGLDHVENYNKEELEKFFSFFEILEGVRVIVCTRPLKHSIGERVYYLKNWNALQTYSYLGEKLKNANAEVCEKIYEMTDGYPILVSYSANYYNLYGKVQLTEKITEVEEYYNLLIKDVNVLSALSVFSITESYLTIRDIEIASGDELITEMVEQFIKSYPYLFEKRFNRYSLLHDSFNTFFRNNVIEDCKLAERQKRFVKNLESDISAGHLRFMNRINVLRIDDEFKRRMLVKYADFKEFQILLKNNFDIEAVVEFYEQLYVILEEHEDNILSVPEYYSFVLLQECIRRVQLDSNIDVVFEQIDYMFNVEPCLFDDVYSNKKLFRFIESLFYEENAEIKARELVAKIQRTRGDEDLYRFFEALKKSRNYFQIEKKPFYKEIFTEQFWNEERENVYEKITEALVYFYVNEKAYRNIGDIIKNILLEGLTEENYKMFFSLFSHGSISKQDIYRIISFIEWRLYALGCIREINPYICKSLEQNIKDESRKGWLDVAGMCQYHIQLAVYERRKIDIISLNKFYTMFAGEYDDSFTYLPDCLNVFEKHNLMEKNESIELIFKLEKLCNSNVSMMERYVNVQGKEEFDKLVSSGILAERFDLQILDLEPELIDMLSEEYIIRKLYEYMRCFEQYKIIEEYQLINVFQSKYSKKVKDVLEREGYRILNLSSKTSEREKNDTYMQRDYLVDDDLEIIKANGESHLFVAQYFDGWYRCFNNLDFFAHYDREILRNDFQKILHISMNATKRIIGTKGTLTCYLANIPIFAHEIGYDECWNEFYSILQQFIDISMIS